MELPQLIWAGDSTPPPYGKMPVEHLKSLHGSSLTAFGHTFAIKFVSNPK